MDSPQADILKILEKCETLIAKGKTKKALTRLISLKEKGIKVKFISLANQFNTIENQFNIGLITHEQFNALSSRLTSSILSTIQQTELDFNAKNRQVEIDSISIFTNASSKDQDKIFLCHASEDNEQVIEVYEKLKTIGFNPWLDKMDLLPGQNWDKEIRKALRTSSFIFIFFSKNSISKKGYVQREFKLALDILEETPEGQIFIVPIRLDNCLIPESFGHIQYIDLFEKGGFDKILKVISLTIPIKLEGERNSLGKLEYSNIENKIVESNLFDEPLEPVKSFSLSGRGLVDLRPIFVKIRNELNTVLSIERIWSDQSRVTFDFHFAPAKNQIKWAIEVVARYAYLENFESVSIGWYVADDDDFEGVGLQIYPKPDEAQIEAAVNYGY